jgi:hypothetical protein
MALYRRKERAAAPPKRKSHGVGTQAMRKEGIFLEEWEIGCRGKKA